MKLENLIKRIDGERKVYERGVLHGVLYITLIRWVYSINPILLLPVIIIGILTKKKVQQFFMIDFTKTLNTLPK